MFNIFKKLIFPIIAMGMTLGIAGNAKADIIFDTLDVSKGGVGGTESSIAQIIGNSGSINVSYGVTFSPIVNSTLTTISPKMFDGGSFGDEIYTVKLYENVGDDIDTSTLLGAVTQSVTNTTSQYVPFDFSGDNLDLMAATTYWIVLSTSGDAGFLNASDVPSAYQASLNGGTSFFDTSGITSIFRVEGTPIMDAVPAPAALSLLSIAVISLAALAYRRRKA